MIVVEHLKCQVLTIDTKTDEEISDMDRDFFGDGQHKWLIGHLTWALTHGYSVQITPEIVEGSALDPKQVAYSDGRATDRIANNFPDKFQR